MKRESIVLQANLSLSLKLTSKGPSIKDVGILEGGGGGQNLSNLLLDSSKNCRHGGGGC